MNSLKNPPLKCFLIEDEPLAINQIKSYIERLCTLNFLGFADDIEFIEELIPFIDQADILFLDIRVSGGDIAALSPLIKSETLIVVTSAFRKEEYPEFLKQRSLCGLQKPITMEQFNVCIQKILKLKFQSNNRSS